LSRKQKKKAYGEAAPREKKNSPPVPLPVNKAKMEQKLTKYLLNPDHPQGASKAIYFANLGYSLNNWQDLAKQLQFDATRAIDDGITVFNAQAYTQHIKINSADGSATAIIRTGWEQKEGQSEIDLITAYPSELDDV
jgi:hypothetical protein